MATNKDASYHHKQHPPTRDERITWATASVVATARALNARPHDAALRIALTSRLAELDALEFAAKRTEHAARSNGEQTPRRGSPGRTRATP